MAVKHERGLRRALLLRHNRRALAYVLPKLSVPPERRVGAGGGAEGDEGEEA